MANLTRSHWYALAATLAAIILTLSAVSASRSLRAQTVPDGQVTEGDTNPQEEVPPDAEAAAEGTATEESSSSEETSAGMESSITFFLRPHCEQEDQTACAAFAVRDPLTVETEQLRVGDILDLDIVVQNEPLLTLTRARSWLQYDPNTLEGMDINASASFPIPAPGEEDFDAEKGYAMIDVEVESEEGLAGLLLPVAQVTFRVKDIPAGGTTMLTFHDPEGEPPHTAVYDEGVDGINVLGEPLGSLAVRIEETVASSPAVSSSPVEEEPPPAEEQVGGETPPANGGHPAADPIAFDLLQVQNVRVTTEGSTLYIAWDALPSAELRGFHVYYGTQTGQYIQRRTVRPDETGIAIRSLTPGTTYFAALRGFNAGNEETAFSQEAAVVIGDPSSSTAPLRTLAGISGNPLRGQAVAVPGDSGLGTTVTFLLLASAVIGTLYAFRRQTTARIVPHA
ncbi:MAG: fibronectin type III domain-containing protein [Patescibacteria group bacterium]